MKRSVLSVHKKDQHHMVGDGFRVYNYFPSHELTHDVISPFLMLDYNPPYHFPPSSHQKGVGTHPHRGFETVTIVYEGQFEHRDSSGGGGKLEAGDVQWMTAGSGILHNEFHQEDFSKNGGVGHMVQLWVNLPAKDKMTAAKYQNLTKENIPVIKLDELGSLLRLFAGEYNGIRGAASTFSPMTVADLRLSAGASLELAIEETQQAMILVTGGEIQIDGKSYAHRELLKLSNVGDRLDVKTNEDSMLLLLTGEAINEPVASYGPFVMNTQREIMDAVNDFNAGKFGSMD
jgi:hypothetical protein